MSNDGWLTFQVTRNKDLSFLNDHEYVYEINFVFPVLVGKPDVAGAESIHYQ